MSTPLRLSGTISVAKDTGSTLLVSQVVSPVRVICSNYKGMTIISHSKQILIIMVKFDSSWNWFRKDK